MKTFIENLLSLESESLWAVIFLITYALLCHVTRGVHADTRNEKSLGPSVYGSHSLVVGATHSSLYPKYLTREGSIAPVEAIHVIHSAGKITKLDMETRRGMAAGEGTPT